MQRHCDPQDRAGESISFRRKVNASRTALNQKPLRCGREYGHLHRSHQLLISAIYNLPHMTSRLAGHLPFGATRFAANYWKRIEFGLMRRDLTTETAELKSRRRRMRRR